MIEGFEMTDRCLAGRFERRRKIYPLGARPMGAKLNYYHAPGRIDKNEKFY
jgi:hypothetical protein